MAMLRPDTVLIFRAKKKKPGYSSDSTMIDANYHATFSLRITQGYAKAICGKSVYVDTDRTLQIKSYNELKDDLSFMGENKKYVEMSKEIGAGMCKNCLHTLAINLDY